MKTNPIILIVLPVVFLCPALQLSIAFGQGNLTPPGAPAPTMKTLDQLSLQITNLSQQVTNLSQAISNQSKAGESRFPISTFQTNLTVPGSYYLTTNLVSGTNSSDAINIRTNMGNMTIDLNGFSIISTNPAGGAASPVGIRLSGATNVVIRNGQFIGFDRSIRAEGSRGILVENIVTHDSRRAGIECDGFAGDPTISTITVRNCIVEGVDGTGEGANVSCDGIVALSCTALIENCVIRDITAVGTGSSSCINAFSPTNTFINNCYLSNAEVGLKMSGGGTRVYYRNVLTSGCGTAFSGTGGVDRGGNF